MSFQPVIKWSGSKRSQAHFIVSQFPDEIDTYYEPFVGGGSVLFALLNSEKQVNQFHCIDANNDLISLWLEIKNNPTELVQYYNQLWIELNKDDNPYRRKDFYMEVRNRFNKERDPKDFVFLNRNCTNGLIRYNQKGEFNSSFHFSRNGILPETLKEIVSSWSTLLNQYNVQFTHGDYKDVSSNSNDIVYCDPPYAKTKGIYNGTINYEEFFQWVEAQEGKVLFSFDGKRGDNDYTYDVPSHLYQNHLYIPSGVSSFTRLKTQETTKVYESLYIC